MCSSRSEAGSQRDLFDSSGNDRFGLNHDLPAEEAFRGSDRSQFRLGEHLGAR